MAEPTHSAQQAVRLSVWSANQKSCWRSPLPTVQPAAHLAMPELAFAHSFWLAAVQLLRGAIRPHAWRQKHPQRQSAARQPRCGKNQTTVAERRLLESQSGWRRVRRRRSCGLSLACAERRLQSSARSGPLASCEEQPRHIVMPLGVEDSLALHHRVSALLPRSDELLDRGLGFGGALLVDL